MDDDEQKLKQLEEGIAEIPIEETKLGRKKEETKQLLFASIPAMSDEDKEQVKAMLGMTGGVQDDDIAAFASV